MIMHRARLICLTRTQSSGCNMKRAVLLITSCVLSSGLSHAATFEEAKQFCDLTSDRASVLYRFAWDGVREGSMKNYIIKGHALMQEISTTTDNVNNYYWAEQVYLLAYVAASKATLALKSGEKLRRFAIVVRSSQLRKFHLTTLSEIWGPLLEAGAGSSNLLTPTNISL